MGLEQSSPKSPYQVELLGAPQGEPKFLEPNFVVVHSSRYPLVMQRAMLSQVLQHLQADGLAPFAGQFVWLLLNQGPGNLLPLGIIAFAVVSVPAVIAAMVGAYFGSRRVLEGEP
jgi:hypothetical protein